MPARVVRILLEDGPELLLSWLGKYDGNTRAAVKVAQKLVAVSGA